MPILEFTNKGIYCPVANLYLDPWEPVENALITHGHADHARFGHQKYVCTPETEKIIRYRLGEDIAIQSLPYRTSLQMDGSKNHFSGNKQMVQTK